LGSFNTESLITNAQQRPCSLDDLQSHTYWACSIQSPKCPRGHFFDHPRRISKSVGFCGFEHSILLCCSWNT